MTKTMEERFREKYCRKHAETGEYKPKWFCNDVSFEELISDISSVESAAIARTRTDTIKECVEALPKIDDGLWDIPFEEGKQVGIKECRSALLSLSNKSKK